MEVNSHKKRILEKSLHFIEEISYTGLEQDRILTFSWTVPDNI